MQNNNNDYDNNNIKKINAKIFQKEKKSLEIFLEAAGKQTFLFHTEFSSGVQIYNLGHLIVNSSIGLYHLSSRVSTKTGGKGKD